MSARFAVIGAGQLGSRYLQGIAAMPVECEIEVFEPFAAARQTAVERFESIEGSRTKRLRFVEKLSALSPDIDVAIVATNADVRHAVCAELFTAHSPRFAILEKVLFQRVSHYADVQGMIDACGSKVWVNHPGRATPFSRLVKSALSPAEPVAFSVIGGGWGMACNTLHYLDRLSFLVDSEALSLSTAGLDPQVFPAKRAGFHEVSGVLAGRLGRACFSIHCLEAPSPATLLISSPSVAFRVDEAAQSFQRAAAPEWQWREESAVMARMQSAITGDLLQEILASGTCSLPTYAQAAALHVPFISALAAHIARHAGTDPELCPIT